MVLPPYIYSTDWREMKQHVSAIIAATPLSCMLYNNPVAYTTDFLPEQIAELAQEHANLAAVKESSADVRRVAAIRAVLGERIEILVGVDDVVVEAVGAGAKGWIAGLVNAFPAESVQLFNLAREGSSSRLSRCIAGFFRCCGWTPCPSLFSSSSGCRRRLAWICSCARAAIRACRR